MINEKIKPFGIFLKCFDFLEVGKLLVGYIELKDQTHSVNEGKSNFVTSENQTAVLSGSNRSIMTHRFHPPIVHQFEIFYNSSTLRPVQLRSKLTSTSRV